MNLEQIEVKIKSLIVDESSLKNISLCKDFISQDLAPIDELEGGEIIRTCLKEHFKLHSDSVKLLIKYHKEVHSEFLKSQCQNQSQEDYQQEILKEIQDSPQYVTISGAQDL